MRADCISDRAGAIALLKEYITGEKYEHSLGVGETAARLAKRYGADVKKAEIAGLLHDITKQQDNVALAQMYGIASVAVKTLHGPVAAEWLRDKGYVRDAEILSAIRYHTTGREDMGLLEQIVYLADFIEPARDFKGVDKLRKLADKDLEKAVLLSIEGTLQRIIAKKGLIDTFSVAAYNYYRNKANLDL